MKKKKNSIYVKQNDNNVLEMQSAAKLYYSIAANLELYICIGNITLFIITLLFESFAIKIIGYVTTIILYIASAIQQSMRKKGAEIRIYIDNYLFDFGNEMDITKIRNKVLFMKKMKPKSMKIYCENDGTKSPPGVKNWYNNYSNKNKEKEIFSCQKENLFFDREIQKKYIIFLYIVIFTLIITIILILTIFWDNNIEKAICLTFELLPFFKNIIEKTLNIKKAEKNSYKMEGILETCEKEPTRDNILKMQNYINERRNMNIDIPNFFHKILSNRLHEEYEYIIDEKNKNRL